MARRRWVSGEQQRVLTSGGQTADRKSTGVNRVGEVIPAGQCQADHHPLDRNFFCWPQPTTPGWNIMRNDNKHIAALMFEDNDNDVVCMVEKKAHKTETSGGNLEQRFKWRELRCDGRGPASQSSFIKTNGCAAEGAHLAMPFHLHTCSLTAFKLTAYRIQPLFLEGVGGNQEGSGKRTLVSEAIYDDLCLSRGPWNTRGLSKSKLSVGDASQFLYFYVSTAEKGNALTISALPNKKELPICLCYKRFGCGCEMLELLK